MLKAAVYFVISDHHISMGSTLITPLHHILHALKLYRRAKDMHIKVFSMICFVCYKSLYCEWQLLESRLPFQYITCKWSGISRNGESIIYCKAVFIPEITHMGHWPADYKSNGSSLLKLDGQSDGQTCVRNIFITNHQSIKKRGEGSFWEMMCQWHKVPIKIKKIIKQMDRVKYV